MTQLLKSIATHSIMYVLGNCEIDWGWILEEPWARLRSRWDTKSIFQMARRYRSRQSLRASWFPNKVCGLHLRDFNDLIHVLDLRNADHFLNVLDLNLMMCTIVWKDQAGQSRYEKKAVFCGTLEESKIGVFSFSVSWNGFWDGLDWSVLMFGITLEI